jgi:predicted NAD/FAD-dependent oxidoreductase
MKTNTQRVPDSVVSSPISVAVIGAGLSGLVAARPLVDHGHRVQVVEKARDPGGRMATRRTDSYAFGHGAQYFTVRGCAAGLWKTMTETDSTYDLTSK